MFDEHGETSKFKMNNRWSWRAIMSNNEPPEPEQNEHNNAIHQLLANAMGEKKAGIISLDRFKVLLILHDTKHRN